MDSLSPNPHTHDDRKRWQTVVSSLITQWWYDSQISLLITAKRTLTPMNSTWSHLTSSSKSGLSYERGFGVRPQTRITAQFSLTMSISQHSAYREELASEVQSSPGGLPCKFQPQALSLLEVRSANVQKLCVCVCVCVCVCACACAVTQSWFFVTPWTAAHQAPLSMGFSRQEYWSGLPFPSPGDLSNPRIETMSLESPANESESHSVVSNSLQPHGLCPWTSPGQNTGVGGLSFLQGIFPTQESNTGLLLCRRILYQLSHKGSPRILEWVAYPISRRSSWPRNRTGVSCIAGRFFTNWDKIYNSYSIQALGRPSN